jgi:hypothetical protein
MDQNSVIAALPVQAHPAEYAYAIVPNACWLRSFVQVAGNAVIQRVQTDPISNAPDICIFR